MVGPEVFDAEVELEVGDKKSVGKVMFHRPDRLPGTFILVLERDTPEREVSVLENHLATSGHFGSGISWKRQQCFFPRTPIASYRAFLQILQGTAIKLTKHRPWLFS